MLEAIKNRHSVRSFSDKPIEENKLQEILNAANSAPSAGGLKARDIEIVRDIQTKKDLAGVSLNQDFLVETPIVLVFFALPEKSAEKYKKRGKKLYSVQDATISASFAWLEAVNQGLSACWIGAFNEDEVRRILRWSRVEYRPICIMPIGYKKL